ncbi:MAG: hypothetical protein AMJ92_05285 [candidate division Zixibacteria bacterium SM23_81]|nr:MAG: hypothetical protein AMJ92_05285 [candidate division Zixibacteria bacterium SM23_81]
MNRVKGSLLIYLLILCFSVLLGSMTLHPKRLSAASGYGASRKYKPIRLTNLRNTVTNFGAFGWPLRFVPYFEGSKVVSPRSIPFMLPFPSCEWPAETNNFYLRNGELWVGGLTSGERPVTTGRFAWGEWSPVEEIEVISELSAFSDEDSYTRYHDIDTGPGIPLDHQPLGIHVSQRTFAWEDSNFIVHDLVIENIGLDDLDSVYVGFCWDFNVASHASDGGAPGDLVGLDEERSISYMYDADGDGGASPGYIGGKFLFTSLAGHAWWDKNHEPDNDADRYHLLSGGLNEDPLQPGDYRLLQSVGPFHLLAGETVPIVYILAIGTGLAGLQETVAEADALLGLVAAEGEGTLNEGDIDSVEVTLGEIKRALPRVQMAVDWEFCDVGLILVDPKGQTITPEIAQTNPLINYLAGPHHKSYDIVDPLLGNWTMVISFINSDSLINYNYSVVISDLPNDFGLPMEYFKVAYSQIVFGTKEEPQACYLDSFEVRGDMELRPGSSFDHNEDPVIVKIGPYQEIIPPGSFEVVGPPEDEIYHYSGSAPGIRDMTLDFDSGWFDVWAGQVDLAGIENPVLVRLAIGRDTGFEEILMDEYPNEWIYDADGKLQPKSLYLEGAIPQAIYLSHNYPNPFNASTQISYSISREARVLLAIYNVRGQQVAILLDKEQSPGTYQATWDGRDAFGNQTASGIYFCHLRANELSQTRKMLLLR